MTMNRIVISPVLGILTFVVEAGAKRQPALIKLGKVSLPAARSHSSWINTNALSNVTTVNASH
jgi:hypothetical protein